MIAPTTFALDQEAKTAVRDQAHLESLRPAPEQQIRSELDALSPMAKAAVDGFDRPGGAARV